MHVMRGGRSVADKEQPPAVLQREREGERDGEGGERGGGGGRERREEWRSPCKKGRERVSKEESREELQAAELGTARTIEGRHPGISRIRWSAPQPRVDYSGFFVEVAAAGSTSQTEERQC